MKEDEFASKWGYTGTLGPDNWGNLDPAYTECSTGKKQSPIDLVGATPSALPEINFDYKPSAINLENNGHSIEWGYNPGSSIDIGGTQYELIQLHFHAPSEHEVNGEHFPMELHVVHKTPEGKVAVIGVLIKEGAENPAYAKLWSILPANKGETQSADADLNGVDLLPANPQQASRYSYEGSLTTPPCTEGVQWNVFEQPIELSQAQIEQFTSIYSNNNRPVFPLNDRELLVSSA
jgi:carbonic anhydrase